jgi:hypothetical protein
MIDTLKHLHALLEQRDNPYRDDWVAEYMPTVFEEMLDSGFRGPTVEEATQSWENAVIQMAAVTLQISYLAMPDDIFADVLEQMLPPAVKVDLVIRMIQ